MKISVEYLAGIIDGEGTINIAHNMAGRGYHPRMSVGTTSKRLVQTLLENFGGKCCPKRTQNPNAKNQWHWYTSGGNLVIDLLKAMRPFLVIKRLQAELVLAVPRFHEFTGKHGRGRTWSELESAQAKEACDALHVLNRRGI